MKLIVGLGNPGLDYARTRHNTGFMALDALALRVGADREKKQGKALVRTAQAAGTGLLLAKPQSYMNLSGDPVRELLSFYKDRIDGFIVVHDDLDLPLGKIRFKDGGGAGGHKGILSITGRLGREGYDRLKVGIGRPGVVPVEAYVLQAFGPEERPVMDRALDLCAEALLFWVAGGCAQAMNRYNSAGLREPASQAASVSHPYQIGEAAES